MKTTGGTVPFCRLPGIRKCLLPLLILLALSSTARAKELVIGLIPELNVFRQVERHKPLAAYLSKALGMEVRLTMLSRYGNILDSFSAGEMDAAFWGSFTGAMAVEKLGLEPLARPVGTDGQSNYNGYIFVRKDSRITSLGELKGKTFAFVDRATTAGYLFPVAALKERGVTDYERFFSAVTFTGSHDAAVLGVLRGEFQGGCAKNTIYRLLEREHPEITRELLVIAESGFVPSNTFGVRHDLDSQLKEKLGKALLELDRTNEGREVLKALGVSRFIPAAKKDYAPVFEMAGKAGINLKTYKYVNK